MPPPRRDHSHRQWQRDPLPADPPRRRGQGPWLSWLVILLLGVIVYLLFNGSPLHRGAADTIIGRASITDGDTIRINGHRIRLHGIDAPESNQRCEDKSGASWRCGEQATRALTDKIGNAEVSCRSHGHDRYRRTIGSCDAGGEDINAWMVRQGWAVAYTRYSLRYIPDEIVARVAGRGIWNGDFTNPEVWRREHRRRNND